LDAVALPSHETPTKLRRRQLGPPPRKEESIRESRAKQQRTQGSPVLAAIVHFSDPASAELIGLMEVRLFCELTPENQPLDIAVLNSTQSI
jgi:hypothetical protein